MHLRDSCVGALNLARPARLRWRFAPPRPGGAVMCRIASRRLRTAGRPPAVSGLCSGARRLAAVARQSPQHQIQLEREVARSGPPSIAADCGDAHVLGLQRALCIMSSHHPGEGACYQQQRPPRRPRCIHYAGSSGSGVSWTASFAVEHGPAGATLATWAAWTGRSPPPLT